jgi:hypothetical protein
VNLLTGKDTTVTKITNKSICFHFLIASEKRKQEAPVFQFNVTAPTLPAAFGYPEPAWNQLINELTNMISIDSRFTTLNEYLHGPLFAKFNLDMKNPNHTFLIGFALSTALVIQQNVQRQMSINRVLARFNQPEEPMQPETKN